MDNENRTSYESAKISLYIRKDGCHNAIRQMTWQPCEFVYPKEATRLVLNKTTGSFEEFTRLLPEGAFWSICMDDVDPYDGVSDMISQFMANVSENRDELDSLIQDSFKTNVWIHVKARSRLESVYVVLDTALTSWLSEHDLVFEVVVDYL